MTGAGIWFQRGVWDFRLGRQRASPGDSGNEARQSLWRKQKLRRDLLSDLYTRAYGQNIIRVRPFFVIGPGRGSNVFVDFAKRIVEIERGGADSLRVGNLSAVSGSLVDVRGTLFARYG